MEQANINQPQIKLGKKNWAMIFSFWMIAQMVYLYLLGINDKEEAQTYLSITNEIIHGTSKLTPNYYLYSGYIFIQLVVHFIGLAYKWVYLVQLILSGLALVAFTSILTVWLSSKKAIITTCFLYATCPFIQSWVCFLYTDSVFTSLLTIAIYFVVFQQYKTKNVIGLWTAILLLPFFRPVGFLFALLVIFYWLSSSKKNWLNIALASIYLIGLLLFINYAFNNSKSFFYPYHNAEANIICGLPSGLMHYINVPYHKGMSMFHFFIANPIMTFYLFSHRLLKSFWITRPYFSTLHNLVIICLLIPYYFLALSGLFSIILQRKKVCYFLIVGIFLFVMPLMLLCVDWLTRFTLPIFPFIFLLVGIGINYWVNRYSNKEGNSNIKLN